MSENDQEKKKRPKLTRPKIKCAIDTQTIASKNRAVRQADMREWLSKKGLVEHVYNVAQKIGNELVEIDDKMLARYKIAIDTNLKLVAKYCPDLKSTEITGEGGNALQIQIVSEFD